MCVLTGSPSFELLLEDLLDDFNNCIDFCDELFLVAGDSANSLFLKWSANLLHGSPRFPGKQHKEEVGLRL